MKIRFIITLLLLATLSQAYAQKKSIDYETNGRSADAAKNPFKKFIGAWTLKDDNWTQNWGGATEKFKIPKHHTVSMEINTDNSLLSIIDGPQPNGHIFWSYNPVSKEVLHLSSFGTTRAGSGTGSLNNNGDVKLKLVFADEAPGTYRLYAYTWVNDDEYHMKSVQYSSDGKPTGLFYEGTFIRVK